MRDDILVITSFAALGRCYYNRTPVSSNVSLQEDFSVLLLL